MSLELLIGRPQCIHCGDKIEDENYNYTYNVAPMWYFLYPEDKEMVPIEGLTGCETELYLEEAIRGAGIHRNALLELEPENGWGSYEGFLQFLQQLLEASVRYPNGVWRADR